MMDEDVAAPDRAPHVRAGLEGPHRERRMRLVLESREVEGRVELEEVGERGEALALVEIVGCQLQLVDAGW